ncbi:hypothetical protein D3C76_1037080 [compost metagenome]
MAVAVEIHGVGAEAARHELRQAHGAGVGAGQAERVDLLLAGQQEELLELLAEEIGARRIVETEGGQRVHHPEVAGIAAEEGLHADDRDDVLRRHAVFLLGAGQGVGVLVPEAHATGDAPVADEHRPVFLPRLDALGGAGNGIEDRLLALDVAEQRDQLLAGEAVVAGHLADELRHLRRAIVVARVDGAGQADHPRKTKPMDAPGRPCAQCLHSFIHFCLQTWAIHFR